MDFCFQKLSQCNALIIADQWKYSGEYSFYDMTADAEDYKEFTCESLRSVNDHYEAVSGCELIGFFCVIQEGSFIELGLGLRPDLCGHGLGQEFLQKIMDFIAAHYRFTEVKLNVAAFNKRAVKVYRSCGFSISRAFKQNTNGSIYDFLEMTKSVGCDKTVSFPEKM